MLLDKTEEVTSTTVFQVSGCIMLSSILTCMVHWNSCIVIILITVYLFFCFFPLKCPVCRDVQVDPCTLACGHSACQLCLARIWESGSIFCPLCKEPWKIIPAINYDYR